jgi:acetyl esterase
MKKRWGGYLLGVLVVVGAAGYAAFIFSPWPTVLATRKGFGADGVERNRALEKHLPVNVTELRDQRYGAGTDAVLDVFFPSDAKEKGKRLPTIVWVHGGAFIAGSKSDVSSYLKILAGRGYTTVGVGYSLAPRAHYPTPVLQTNEALAFLARNADRLPIDNTKFFLAGDSAGAQIASQLAAAIANPPYAATVGVSPAVDPARLKGIVLFCGVYDTSWVRTDGEFAEFHKTIMWSYFGRKDYDGDPRLAEFSVNRHLTPQFPPAFVSVGNDDQFASQSVMFADAVRAQGVEVDTLFFPADYKPPLFHEYQFDLDGPAGQLALDRLTSFLAKFAH